MFDKYSSTIVIIFLLTTIGFSQNNVINTQNTIDSVQNDLTYSIYNFRGINKYPEYFDKSKYEEIVRLEKEKKWEQLFKELKEYVSRFGILNFYKDTKLIWKLAKMTELLASNHEAKILYRMVLKHHHQDIDIREIELYFDSLNQQEIQQFVPLDYYYELVEHRKLIDTLRPPKGILLNMGRLVNSTSADYAPSLNIHNDLLIFTSKRKKTIEIIKSKEDENLFFTRKDQYDTWSKAKPIDALNTKYNEGSSYVSHDGKTLFFSRCDCPDCFGSCDLFYSEIQSDSTWTQPVNLGLNVNTRGWDSHPALSITGDTLFFASDRLGGFGLSDIYFSIRNKKGEWQPAQNMGPTINTRNNDLSPFFHPTYGVLYFSSNGQLYNFGEFDIYKSYGNNGYWSEPQNIGPLVNGRGSELYFTIDSQSEFIFYARSSDNDLSKQDIYSFSIPMGAHPNAITTVRGSLTDAVTKVPFHGIVSIIDLNQKIEIAPKYLEKDGTFEFDLINNRDYLLIIQGDDFFRIEELFYLDGPLELHKVTEPLASRVKFESIEFDVGKSDIKEEMYADLNKIVNFLYDNFDFKLKISGHTDSHGNLENNLRLSKERAQNIRDYIVIFAGIFEERIQADGYGSIKPIIENEITEKDRRVNRRVEFEIYREAQEENVNKN